MFRIRPLFRVFQSSLRTSQTPSSPPRNHAQTRFHGRQRPLGRGPQYKRFTAADGISTLFSRWAASPTFYRDVSVITAAAGGFYVYNLEEVPVSGRRRFNIISPDMEEWIGRVSVDEVKSAYKGSILDDKDERVMLVKKVLQRLIPYAEGEGLKGLNWEVTVIDSPEINAFVAPGGKVFVYTGILPLCEDEDGIAAVLGHEIAHVVAHHTAERMSQGPLILLGVIALSLFDLSIYSSKMLVDLFLSMPASRKHEAEADYIGLLMMARGCYRPEAAMEIWARMENLGDKETPQILSTHPSNRNREEKIREWLPQAWGKAELSQCHEMSQYAAKFHTTLDSFIR